MRDYRNNKYVRDRIDLLDANDEKVSRIRFIYQFHIHGLWELYKHRRLVWLGIHNWPN